MNEKFHITDCTEINLLTYMNETKLSFEQRKQVCNYMLNNFQPYKMTKLAFEERTYYFGNYSLQIGDTILAFFGPTEKDGKRYFIYYLYLDNDGIMTELSRFYIVEGGTSELIDCFRELYNSPN